MFDVFYSGVKPNLFAHERRACDIQHARELSRTRWFWWVNYLTDYSGFDFLFEPPPWQAEYTHTWPSQWHEYSGTYLVPTNTSEIQYYFNRQTLPNRDNMTNYNLIKDNIIFDYTWAPHPFDPPYRYIFGNQWYPANRMPTVEYRVPGATEIKYVFTPRAELKENKDNNWTILTACEFDYSWIPDPGDPPYIYIFGNQWHRAEIMPTVKYTVPGATEIKYMPYPRANLKENKTNWVVPDNIVDVDYTWHPDPGDPPYIYQFGTQHQATGGPKYCIPGATEIKYITTPRARRIKIDDLWTIPENTNLEAFDLTWHPDSRDAPYIYQFPTQWNRAGGPVYSVPGATEIKYVTQQIARMLPTDRNWAIPEGIDVNSFDFSWTPDATEKPYIYQFGTQWQKTGGPRYVVPKATEIKYITEPRADKINKDNNWTIPTGADVESFDWTWHPDATEQPYIYQFGTQHQRTGGPQYRVPGATDTKYIDQIRIRTDRVATAIYEIDHLDGNAGKISDTVKVVRYFDNYLDTLKRLAKNIPDEYEFVWICSSICDYSDFDFTWHPEVWQAGMLHVFPSDGEKFGDTFFMHVPTFKYRSEKLQLLDWYDLNFMDINVPRRPLPVIQHTFDTHVDAVKQIDFNGPLALFTTGSVPNTIPAVPLWREKTKTVVPLSVGGTQTIVPKTAVPWIKEQLYDYPFIDKTQRDWCQDADSDVIFISNGESMADANWANLLELCPRARRSDGVLGREAAYKAAAEMSSTPWFFAVFAKTEVLPSFKFDYQPDRLQQPRHYIFHSRNPLNGLEYGAMNINLYNRQLTIDTRPGIDFTLSSLHTVVPICASISRFNTDPWVTWRSAFREVLKLKLEVDQGADVEIQYRLKVWSTKADGDNAEYCLAGANDALEYYAKVAGNYDQLCLSFDWEWLQEFYYTKYQRKLWLELV
jgi:hypothetical protein